MQKQISSSSFSNSYLSWDVFFTGGFSILMCLGTWALVDKSASLVTVSQLAFSLAFLVNHPHFLSSYILMYRDFKKSIWKKKRYFFSAVAVPIVLAGALGFALIEKNATWMGYIINSMYILVGWHYVKQIFGFVIVSSAQRKIFYQAWERRILLVNLISVWFMSVLAIHVGDSTFDFYGIRHFSLGIPSWLSTVNNAVVGISLVTVLIMQLRKYLHEGVKPSPPGVAAYLAIYAWYLPVASHPSFGYLIPFFHSMQYLSFVWLMKRNQIRFEIKSLQDREWRTAWIKKFGGFAAGALILGALFFEFIPKALDGQGFLPQGGEMGSAPFMAAFLLFINIHHYFIDNTIWRSDNEVVRNFLMKPDVTATDRHIHAEESDLRPSRKVKTG